MLLKIKINTSHSQGGSALCNAVEGGCVEAVRILLDRGASIDTETMVVILKQPAFQYYFSCL